jgi:hypothetical protein
VRVVVLFSLLLITSCFWWSHPSYPPEWPNLSQDTYEGCPKITGTYSDLPYERFPKNLGDDNLSVYLLKYRHGDIRPSAKMRVMIVQSQGGALEIAVWEDETLIGRKTYSEQANDYHCEGTELVFSHLSGFGDVGLGVSSSAFALSKASDGSLVSRHYEGGLGLIYMILPVIGSETQWYRYMPWPSR